MGHLKVAVTGSRGFIGKNLLLHLKRIDDILVYPISHTEDLDKIGVKLQQADIIFYLAGVNRPDNESDFVVGNVDFLKKIIELVKTAPSKPRKLFFTSSTQSMKDNPYGRSKKDAEDFLIENSSDNLKVFIGRLPNVFGKFCLPNYNSVVATFCHNIQRGLPIQISNPSARVNLLYVDDLISKMLKWAFSEQNEIYKIEESFEPVHEVSLGDLADSINSFHDLRENFYIPTYKDPFYKKLHSTFQSYMVTNSFAYHLNKKVDDRGYLAEFVKSHVSGQIFVSKTKPGITRGNHFHHTKLEKFYVVEGQAIVKFRHMYSHHVIEYNINGDEAKVIDIPPGYTHSITNIGKVDLITIFWANEIFDQKKPDTYFTEVGK